jgi:hypothetical protein
VHCAQNVIYCEADYQNKVLIKCNICKQPLDGKYVSFEVCPLRSIASAQCGHQ